MEVLVIGLVNWFVLIQADFLLGPLQTKFRRMRDDCIKIYKIQRKALTK